MASLSHKCSKYQFIGWSFYAKINWYISHLTLHNLTKLNNTILCNKFCVGKLTSQGFNSISTDTFQNTMFLLQNKIICQIIYCFLLINEQQFSRLSELYYQDSFLFFNIINLNSSNFLAVKFTYHWKDSNETNVSPIDAKYNFSSFQCFQFFFLFFCLMATEKSKLSKMERGLDENLFGIQMQFFSPVLPFWVCTGEKEKYNFDRLCFSKVKKKYSEFCESLD